MGLRDRQEISWTIWGPSVPPIGSRPIERNHRRSRSTSRILRLRSDPIWGAIGHSKVQVISCRSLMGIASCTASSASLLGWSRQWGRKISIFPERLYDSIALITGTNKQRFISSEALKMCGLCENRGDLLKLRTLTGQMLD